jgi:hypothetical protein
VFFHYEREVTPLAAHVEEQRMQAARFGDHEHGPDEVSVEGTRAVFVGYPKEILGVNEPQYVVQVAAIDGKA